MVYYYPENNDTFSIQNTTPRNRPVYITYNGSGLHDFTGPVPMVDISQSVSRNGAGSIEGHITKIDLSGKIVRTGVDGDVLPGGSGIGPVVSGIKEFKDFLSKNDNGVLEIKCGVTDTIFSASGVRLLDISFNKSNDNWLYTADYTASFEYYEPSGITSGFYVKSTSDNWSIEAVEDNVYVDTNIGIETKPEIHNPQLKPTPPTPNSPVPGSYNGSGPIGSNNLDIINIPQYKISHRVSAVGIPRETGNNSVYSSYLEAKKWVEHRLSSSFYQSSPSSGLAYFVNSSNPTFDKIYLYNHVRSTNFSITEGNYEVNETWLAMPSGIPFTEDYSVEASTDDRNIKTVRVNGTIKGLNLSSWPLLTGSSQYTNPSGNGSLNLNEYNQQLSSGLSHKILDNKNQTSSSSNISKYRYENALSGWLYDIKPYLYKRAALVMNSKDRVGEYQNSTNPSSPVLNPIYCKENLLNPNPLSTTEGHDPRKGTISYSVEYNNKLMLISGVISENISVNTTGPADVFSESFIIGRRLGPILQSLNARTATRKDITIDITVSPPRDLNGVFMTNTTCPLYTGGYLYTTIESLINVLRPFGTNGSTTFGNISRNTNGQTFITQDNHNWNPAEGRYSRSVSYVYQPCSNSTNYMDH